MAALVCLDVVYIDIDQFRAPQDASVPMQQQRLVTPATQIISFEVINHSLDHLIDLGRFLVLPHLDLTRCREFTASLRDWAMQRCSTAPQL